MNDNTNSLPKERTARQPFTGLDAKNSPLELLVDLDETFSEH